MVIPLNLIIAVLILVAVGIWLASLISEAKLKKAIEKESDATLFLPQFRCVLINPSNHSCRSALEFRARPILIDNAPKLPLLGCDAKQCECSFLQYDDRRMGKDRRDREELDKMRRSIYANKRLLKDRRRASIQAFLLPQYRKQQFS